MIFRVIVAGDRRLDDYAFVEAKLDALLANRLPDVVILSGAAPGADTLGEAYASLHGLDCERFFADWKQHGKAAGPIRNRRMAESQADACILFDGGGPGSASMRRIAEEFGLALRVIDVRHLVPRKKGGQQEGQQ